MLTIIIPIIFTFCFFLESIFGFGGMILSLSLLGFFLDIKEVLYLAIYVGISASICVLITDHKSFSLPVFKSIIPHALLGTIVGVYFIDKLSSTYFLKLFSLFIIFFSAKNLFFASYKFPKTLKKPFIFIGGLMQGIYGTGGPFTLLAVKNDFATKSELRTTIAVYFIFFNLVRIVQMVLFSEFNTSLITSLWWVIFPLFLAIWVGFHIHVRVPEKLFHSAVSVLLLFAGTIFLFK